MRLARYLFVKFLMMLAGVFGIFFVIMVLINMVEEIRRSGSTSATLANALGLAALSAPQGIYEILPLVVLLAGIAAFLGLARSSELVVIRAVGVSTLQSLGPAIAGALVAGVFGVAVLNPLVASTERRYDVLSERYRSDGASTLSVGQEAIWLRQGGRDGQWVIRADHVGPEVNEIQGATFVGFDHGGTPVRRLEAARAVLDDGAWQLSTVKEWDLTADNPERDASQHESLALASTLSRSELRDSLEQPSSISFWQLSDYIRRLERAGFSSRSLQVAQQVAFASPLLMVAMVLTAAGFTMRHARLGRTGIMLLTAVLCGFALFFLRNFAQILGENGQIPILLAAWSPPVIGILFAAGLILQMENG